MVVPIISPSSATAAADAAAINAHQQNIHDLKAALATTTTTCDTTYDGNMSENDDITPSSAAVHIPWSSDSFLDTSSDEPMEPGSFEGPEKLLEIHFSPRMQEVQHIRTPFGHNNNSNNDMSLDETENRYGLRIIPKAVWETMLDIVKCKVLHSIHHPTVDAYVLSESSFFVFPHKLILKTCGTTTLLMALPKILELAQEWCGLIYKPSSDVVKKELIQQPYRVFYSRKKFLFPEKQIHVHREWKDEVEFLDRHFENGSAYTIGKVNGDHWCLYVTAPFYNYNTTSISSRHGQIKNLKETAMENFTADEDTIQDELYGLPPTRPLSRASSHCRSPHLSESESEDTLRTTIMTQNRNEAEDEDYDQTIEILMTDLNPLAMRKFYHHSTQNQPSGIEGGRVVDQHTGLAALFPGAEIDSFLFTPCGYSANALLKDARNADANGKYFTIHVTPEPICSYASFETNIPVRLSSKSSRRSAAAAAAATASKNSGAPETVQDLVRRVVEIFQPGNLTVTIFASNKNTSVAEKQAKKRQFKLLHSMGSFPGFRRTDRILYGLDGYDLIYGHYLAEC
ncbi:spermidine resistance protein [Linnemannia zychae]|nr:spermidine resistance protein [Linnemannia zychae]